MKRRRFIQTLAATPVIAIPAVPKVHDESPAESQGPPVQEAPKLEISVPDAVAESALRLFSPQQFAALRKLSDLLLPALKGMPGALEAGAPEFLDFLIGASPSDRQQLYKMGLDALNAQSRKLYSKAFAEVSDPQAVVLLAPLRQPWTYDPPADPFARFLREVKQDVRSATMNSREYASAGSQGSRRGAGVGQYWYPID